MFYVISLNKKVFLASSSTLKNFGFLYTPFLKKAKRFKSLTNALRWFGSITFDSSLYDTFYLYVIDGDTIKEKIDINFYI